MRVLAFVLISTALEASQAGGFTLRVDVPVVTVDVSVIDENGRPVDGLTVSDFQVLENGLPQPVRYFGSSAAPYHTYLLLDSSGSTRHKWEFMRRAVAGFLSYLKPQDRISIGMFDSRLVRLRAWSAPETGLLAALDPLAGDLPPGGTTEFYRSLERALDSGFDGIAERRAIVILTDGRDTSLYQEIVGRNRMPDPEADRGFSRVYRTAQARQIPIYIVALNTDRNIEENSQGGDEYRNLQILFGDSPVPEAYLEQVRTRIERLAAVTGGQVLFPKSIDEVVSLFEDIGRTLGGAYSLGYVPEGSRPEEGIRRIVVKAGSYRVRQSRDSYYNR